MLDLEIHIQLCFITSIIKIDCPAILIVHDFNAILEGEILKLVQCGYLLLWLYTHTRARASVVVTIILES